MKGPRGAKGRLPRPRAPLAEVALFPLGVASSLAYYSARCVLPKAKEGEMRVNSLALRTEIALWIRHCGTKLCGTKKKGPFGQPNIFDWFHIEWQFQLPGNISRQSSAFGLRLPCHAR